MTRLPAALVAAIPLLPEPDEARDLLERELADPVYDAAEPNFLDRAARAVQEFFTNLFSPALPDSWGPAVAVIVAVVVALVFVAALLIWGRPRRAARSRIAPGSLFDSDDARTAAQLRGDAARAASEERWDAAVILRFRALARGLAERTVVDPAPGETAQSFARTAGLAFPDAGGRFTDAARAFDDVRYLRRPASAELYADLSALDEDIARARPAFAGGRA